MSTDTGSSDEGAAKRSASGWWIRTGSGGGTKYLHGIVDEETGEVERNTTEQDIRGHCHHAEDCRGLRPATEHEVENRPKCGRCERQTHKQNNQPDEKLANKIQRLVKEGEIS